MNFKKGIISTALSLTLLMPSVAFAGAGTNGLQLQKNFGNPYGITGQNFQHPRPELTPEMKTKLKELKTKLENKEITKEQFYEELKKLMPEGYKFQHHQKDFYKDLSDESKVKLKELKTKLQNKEITEDEFRKELNQIMSGNNK